jgi:hypothetical protein
MKIAHFVLIGYQTWPRHAILVSDWSISKKSKQELPVAAMFVNGSGRNEQSLYRTFHRCFLPIFRSIGFEVSEENIKM